MPNEEHLRILRQGVDAWNKWRTEHPKIQPNLSGVNLDMADLSGADLSRVNLIRANLSGVNLDMADLSGADLSRAILIRADLSGAILYMADLSGAYLNGANLSRANLSAADLSRADLSGAGFKEAGIGWTTFGNVDLSIATGLDSVRHVGPSTIGVDTLYLSGGRIPEVFLRNAGVPEQLIAYLPSLLGRAIDFYSCFISYSTKDQEFAERLHASLQTKGVRCWFAAKDMRIGDKIRDRLDQSIRGHDKLLLILSAHSVASEWVEDEVNTAFEEERRRQKTVLFPVRLDDAVFETKEPWAAKVRQRYIGDFRQWERPDEYRKALERLLRDLESETEPGPD